MPGNVIVFNPTKMMRFQAKAVESTKEILGGMAFFEQSPEIFTQYFELYYDAQNSLDSKKIIPMLSLEDGKHPHFAFKEAAKAFQLIDDTLSNTIFIPYDNNAQEKLRLLHSRQAQENPRFCKALLRQLQRYSISIQEKEARQMLGKGDLLEIIPGVYQLKYMDTLYSEDTGLKTGSELLLDSAACIV